MSIPETKNMGSLDPNHVPLDEGMINIAASMVLAVSLANKAHPTTYRVSDEILGKAVDNAVRAGLALAKRLQADKQARQQDEGGEH